MKNFSYLQPKDLREASSMLSNGMNASAMSGGTDLLDLMKSEISTPEAVVNLKSIRDPKLHSIEDHGGSINIGSLVPLSEIADNRLLKEQCTVLQQAAAEVASPQLRNMGTLGGNLCQRPRCWYYRDDEFDCLRKGGDSCFAVDGRNRYHCVTGGGPCFIVHPSDLAVALLALDANVLIQKGKKNRSIPIAEFYVLPKDDTENETILKPGEVVSGVEILAATADTRSAYTKFKVRQSWDFAVVSVAVTLEMSGGTVNRGRIALGGVAPVPWLEKQASNSLTGFHANEATLKSLAESMFPNANPMSENAYKVPLARNLVKRTVRELMG
jgi:xanthine dehydrogenase YagS FAD-binding subunit